MSHIVVKNANEIKNIEPYIKERLATFGAEILDPHHYSFLQEERIKILRSKYWNQ